MLPTKELNNKEVPSEINGLKPLLIEHRQYFQQTLSTLNYPLTDYSFVNIYPYTEFLKLAWRTIHNHLCIFMAENDLFHLLLPPIPEAGATTVDLKNALLHCLQLLNQHNDKYGKPQAGTIQTVSDEMLTRINQCGIKGLVSSPSFVSGDFIYDMQKMITLSGNSLSSKRYARNKFLKDYPNFRTAPINSLDIPACIKLLGSWHEGKKINDSSFLHDKDQEIHFCNEKAACEIAIKHCHELDLKGMTLFVGDHLIGFTLGEALTSTQASIIFEKTHPDFDGSSAFIFSEFCRLYWSEYKECNVGDDANNPSLRFAKEHYRPVRLLNKSIISQI